MHEFIVQIASKSGAAQAAPAAPLPTALQQIVLSQEDNVNASQTSNNRNLAQWMGLRILCISRPQKYGSQRLVIA